MDRSECLLNLVGIPLDVDLESAQVREVSVDSIEMLGELREGMTITVRKTSSVKENRKVLQQSWVEGKGLLPNEQGRRDCLLGHELQSLRFVSQSVTIRETLRGVAPC